MTWLYSKSSLCPAHRAATWLQPQGSALPDLGHEREGAFRNLLLADLRLLSPERRSSPGSKRELVLMAWLLPPPLCPGQCLLSLRSHSVPLLRASGILLQLRGACRGSGVQDCGDAEGAPYAVPTLSSQAWRSDHAGG